MENDDDEREKLPKEITKNERSTNSKQDSPQNIIKPEKLEESPKSKHGTADSSKHSGTKDQTRHSQNSRSQIFSGYYKKPNRYGMDPQRNLFPKTKKYHYFPITCDYCEKLFPPNKIKSHKQKIHNEGPKPSPTTSPGTSKKKPKNEKSKKVKSPRGIPGKLQTCYICGQLYGSRSLGIHEPKCLEKWKIQNKKLPLDMRQPEPKKSEPLAEKGAKEGEYSLPEVDPNAKATFRHHLKTLIACKHCSRTFSPDRILIHQDCCIERPRRRKYTSSSGGGRKR